MGSDTQTFLLAWDQAALNANFGLPRVYEMSSEHQREVDANFDEFQKILPSLMAQHMNKFALMKSGQILGYYSSAEDAAMAASQFIKDGLYSIQQVTSSRVDLGFFNYAIPVN
jgi:hypothetical protein